VTRKADDMNAYLNFVLYAVLGRLPEADGLLTQHGDGVRRVARWLNKQCPPPAVPLYRGMLVDPAQPLRANLDYKFLSWTEDPQVACWFASRESVISEHVIDTHPNWTGVVLMLPPSTPRATLFHHAWADAWDGSGQAAFARLAMRHPHMGYEGAQQITWSLQTQREVIIDPLSELPLPVPVESLNPKPVAELDRRFSPPWIG
jgi:hypothetical protein